MHFLEENNNPSMPLPTYFSEEPIFFSVEVPPILLNEIRQDSRL